MPVEVSESIEEGKEVDPAPKPDGAAESSKPEPKAEEPTSNGPETEKPNGQEKEGENLKANSGQELSRLYRELFWPFQSVFCFFVVNLPVIPWSRTLKANEVVDKEEGELTEENPPQPDLVENDGAKNQ